MELINRVGRFIQDNSLLKDGDRVVVGVSGGADSVALLLLLRGLGFECTAVHCNFHLRGAESDRDQEFVQSLCSRMDIPLRVCHYDTKGYAAVHKCSIEMAARQLRYADFETIRQETGSAAIVVAHHRDDSVETVLMNLTRGTGIRGLAGIKPVNGHVVRPMLCATRAEIEQWLESVSQPFVTDSTNLEQDYTRNKIRLQLLPMMRGLNPDVDNAVFRTSQRLTQVLDIYRNAIDAAMAESVSQRPDGVLAIDVETVRAFVSPEALLFEILSPYGFNEWQIEDIARSLDGGSGKCFTACGGQVVKDRSSLLLRPASDSTAGFSEQRIVIADGLGVRLQDGRSLAMRIMPAGAPLVRDSATAMLDASLLSGELTLRLWRNGDSFVPFGMRGRKLVSDFMTDCKMSLLEKRDQLVLCNGDDIVWVVGRRIDNRYRVSKDTMQILFLYLQNTETN